MVLVELVGAILAQPSGTLARELVGDRALIDQFQAAERSDQAGAFDQAARRYRRLLFGLSGKPDIMSRGGGLSLGVACRRALARLARSRFAMDNHFPVIASDAIAREDLANAKSDDRQLAAIADDPYFEPLALEARQLLIDHALEHHDLGGAIRHLHALIASLPENDPRVDRLLKQETELRAEGSPVGRWTGFGGQLLKRSRSPGDPVLLVAGETSDRLVYANGWSLDVWDLAEPRAVVGLLRLPSKAKDITLAADDRFVVVAQPLAVCSIDTPHPVEGYDVLHVLDTSAQEPALAKLRLSRGGATALLTDRAPLVRDGRAYAAVVRIDSDGEARLFVEAWDLAMPGEIVWRVGPLARWIVARGETVAAPAPVAAADGWLYIATGHGAVLALSAADGAVAWAQPYPLASGVARDERAKQPSTRPLIAGGAVYVAPVDGIAVQVFDLDGRDRREADPLPSLDEQLVVANDRVLRVGQGDRGLLTVAGIGSSPGGGAKFEALGMPAGHTEGLIVPTASGLGVIDAAALRVTRSDAWPESIVQQGKNQSETPPAWKVLVGRRTVTIVSPKSLQVFHQL